eukprot:TRINITY_DN10894_c0_g1_i1.p1 TRINITY_DN10894_c0_g1~~TRINITY_DN10894_c0_g1_i1.p1  ORF type:complete len:751 (-),score=80.89 TRINITY_DN10894_c0_g1_i1:11-2263(-)
MGTTTSTLTSPSSSPSSSPSNINITNSTKKNNNNTVDLPFDWPEQIPLLSTKDVSFSHPRIKLGGGMAGQVFLGTYKGTIPVAIKSFRIFDYDSFYKELAALSSIMASPYVVHIYGAFLHASGEPMMVMEYAENGNLHDYTLRQGIEFQLGHPLWTRIVCDIVKAMMCVHGAGLIHRDLKPENILVVSDDPYCPTSTIKICDFGLSRPDDETQTLSCGTVKYMAPEILQDKRGKCSSRCDVYSFGMVLYFMLMKVHPFHEEKGDSFVIMNLVAKGGRPHIPSSVPRNISRLLQNCWQGAPAGRPSFESISAQNFFPGADIFVIIERALHHLPRSDWWTLALLCKKSLSYIRPWLEALQYKSDKKQRFRFVQPMRLHLCHQPSKGFFSDHVFIIPSSVKEVILDDAYTSPLPLTVTSVELGTSYSQPLPLLPANLASLHLGSQYNLPIEGGQLPDSLTSLHLGCDFNQPLPDPLPSHLSSLHLGLHFNQPLSSALPLHLTSLHLGYGFNQPFFGPLPLGLTSLYLGFSFNHPLPQPLPPNLTSLHLGARYNHPFTEPLPPSLTTLHLGVDFNYPLPSPLPPNLISLRKRSNYGHPVPDFPSSSDLYSNSMKSVEATSDDDDDDSDEDDSDEDEDDDDSDSDSDEDVDDDVNEGDDNDDDESDSDFYDSDLLLEQLALFPQTRPPTWEELPGWSSPTIYVSLSRNSSPASSRGGSFLNLSSSSCSSVNNLDDIMENEYLARFASTSLTVTSS